MVKSFPTQADSLLDALPADQAVEFTCQLLTGLEALLPDSARVFARKLNEEFSRWRSDRHKGSQAFYQQDFVPLTDLFFDFHGTDYAVPVNAVCRLSAYTIKRINAFERERDEHTPTMPDDVREVGGREVMEMLETLSAQLGGCYDQAADYLVTANQRNTN